MQERDEGNRITLGKAAFGPPDFQDSFTRRLHQVQEKKARLMNDMVRLQLDELALERILRG